MNLAGNHIYILARAGTGGGSVKIGISLHPEQRLRQVEAETGLWLTLERSWEVIGPKGSAYRVEQCTHAILQHALDHHEWFHVSVAKAAATIQKSAGLLMLDLGKPFIRVHTFAPAAPPIARLPLPWTPPKMVELIPGVLEAFGITREQLDAECDAYMGNG